MYPSRLFKTASFKLAAACALIFGMSSAAVTGLVFLNIKAALDKQERTRIQAEAFPLREEFSLGGLQGLLVAIRERQRGHLAGGLDYSIVRSDGERIFGDLPKMPLSEGWKSVSGPPDGDEPEGKLERLNVYREKLSPDLWLLVGDDKGRVAESASLVLQESVLGFLFSLMLAVGGGIAVSHVFLNRIDSITRTAEAIIDGDLARRMPLRGVGDDIDRLSSTLNRMLDRIAGLMDALRHVTINIAHDLRTPLGRLRQYLEETRRRSVNIKGYEDAVDHAIVEADEMLETFSAMLRIAEIESGKRVSGFGSLDLGELVSSVMETFKPVAEESAHCLEVVVAGRCLINGDAELIVQLVVNLIENAMRHTPAGTNIAINVHAADGTVILQIADDGPGVLECEREKIFRRFYRGELSRTTPGNGLGLSLVAAIASLHGVPITVADNHPGLLMRFEFPAFGNTANAGRDGGQRRGS